MGRLHRSTCQAVDVLNSTPSRTLLNACATRLYSYDASILTQISALPTIFALSAFKEEVDVVLGRICLANGIQPANERPDLCPLGFAEPSPPLHIAAFAQRNPDAPRKRFVLTLNRNFDAAKDEELIVVNAFIARVSLALLHSSPVLSVTASDAMETQPPAHGE